MVFIAKVLKLLRYYQIKKWRTTNALIGVINSSF